MMLEEFTIRLKNQLSEELPGLEAQNKMLPTARDERFVFPVYETAPVHSAVLILFYQGSDGHIHFPLIQRTTSNGAHSGQVGLPGGKYEERDLTMINTALREAHEEIGIDPANCTILGSLTPLHIAVSNFVVTPIAGFTNVKPSFIPEPSEVENIIESPLDDLLNPALKKNGTIIIRDNLKVQTPYFDLANRVVWGATAMILSELTEIIERAGISLLSKK